MANEDTRTLAEKWNDPNWSPDWPDDDHVFCTCEVCLNRDPDPALLAEVSRVLTQHGLI